jgi:hypothetical protein
MGCTAYSVARGIKEKTVYYKDLYTHCYNTVTVPENDMVYE